MSNPELPNRNVQAKITRLFVGQAADLDLPSARFVEVLRLTDASRGATRDTIRRHGQVVGDIQGEVGGGSEGPGKWRVC